MAPVYPFQILLFVSMFSFSGSFLMKRSGSSLLRPRLSSSGGIYDDFLSPSEAHSQAESRNELAPSVNASGLDVRKPVSVLDTDLVKTFLWIKLNDAPNSVVESNDALKYVTTEESGDFAKTRRRSDVSDNYVLENVSWKSQIASKRTWPKWFRYAGLDSATPRGVSLAPDLDLDKRQKSSVSERLDKPIVQSKDFDYGGESKLWISVGNLKNALQKLSADENNPWLPLDKEYDTDSELITELNRDVSPGQDGADTYYEEDILDEDAPSSEGSEELWLKSALNSLPSHPHPTSEQTNPAISKRFRVPIHHKKVFVYGHDDRLRVFLPQMRKFPFSNIARLSTGCTGTLVTPRHVLTAAHCVHNGVGFRNNLEKLKIEIPDTMGFKDYYAQKITIPTGWLRENRSGRGRQNGRRAVYDYAVVRLKLAVTGRSKFLALAVPRPEVLQMDFHFLAFPQDDQQLWRSVCLASQHMALGDGNLILTRCDAAVGNSGAAVFIQDPHGGLKVVGILSNTMHVSHHRSFFRYSIITALTWPKLTDICNELGPMGRKYNVCPPVRFMRRTSYPPRIKVIPFFGKRSSPPVTTSKAMTTLWL